MPVASEMYIIEQVLAFFHLSSLLFLYNSGSSSGALHCARSFLSPHLPGLSSSYSHFCIHSSLMAALAIGAKLNHIARESSDVKRLASFYQEVLGLDRIETPNFGDFEVIWLRLSPGLTLHLIERNPVSKLPERPHVSSPASALTDPRALPRSHHISFSVSNYEGFVQYLKERGIQTFEKTQPDGKTMQVFFFDPDGNGLEVGNWEN